MPSNFVLIRTKKQLVQLLFLIILIAEIAMLETCIFQIPSEGGRGSQGKLWMTGNALKTQALVIGFQSLLRNLEIIFKSTRKKLNNGLL